MGDGLEQARLDHVCFVPTAVPPHKQTARRTAADSRVEMLELAIGGHEALEVSRQEIDRGGVSYTVDTLEEFKQRDPQGELFFLMGADSLADLPQWREPERILQIAVPVVARRAGATEPDFRCLEGLVSPERLEEIHRCQVAIPLIELSSREIRRRAAAGQSIRYQTPRAVAQYILAHQLYQQSPD